MSATNKKSMFNYDLHTTGKSPDDTPKIQFNFGKKDKPKRKTYR